MIRNTVVTAVFRLTFLISELKFHRNYYTFIPKYKSYVLLESIINNYHNFKNLLRYLFSHALLERLLENLFKQMCFNCVCIPTVQIFNENIRFFHVAYVFDRKSRGSLS